MGTKQRERETAKLVPNQRQETFSSLEAALLLVSIKNRDLWEDPTPEVRDSVFLVLTKKSVDSGDKNAPRNEMVLPRVRSKVLRLNSYYYECGRSQTQGHLLPPA